MLKRKQICGRVQRTKRVLTKDFHISGPGELETSGSDEHFVHPNRGQDRLALSFQANDFKNFHEALRYFNHAFIAAHKKILQLPCGTHKHSHEITECLPFEFRDEAAGLTPETPFAEQKAETRPK